MANYPQNRIGYHGPRIHFPRASSAPTLHPTTLDIAWAAGLYEGEGSICKAKGCHFGQGLKVTVTQKDEWVTQRLRDLFGGSLGIQKGNEINPFPNSKWTLSGARAHGFTMTIYRFLSPRRQEQLRTAWGPRLLEVVNG